jgi:hypothetical protein
MSSQCTKDVNESATLCAELLAFVVNDDDFCAMFVFKDVNAAVVVDWCE